MSGAAGFPRTIDALDAAIVGIGRLYQDLLEEELTPPAPPAIDVGRAAAPAPRFAALEHI